MFLSSLALVRNEGFEVTELEMRDAALDRYGDVLTPEQVDAIAGGLSAEPSTPHDKGMRSFLDLVSLSGPRR